MTAQAPELATVVVRLEKVEQQNRKLKMVGVVVLGLAVAGMVMGQAMPRAQIVEAEGFVLKDAAGKVRAKLNVGKDGPGLTLADENKPRAGLNLFKDGVMLDLYDENGKIRVGLYVIKEGPGLVLHDENGKFQAKLNAYKDGPMLALYDENGKPRAGLVVDKDGPLLTLYDKNGKVVWGEP